MSKTVTLGEGVVFSRLLAGSPEEAGSESRRSQVSPALQAAAFSWKRQRPDSPSMRGEQKTQSVDRAEETSCLTTGFQRFLNL